MPKSSKRTSDELVHAPKKQIAGILGIADSSVRAWSVIPTFPRENAEGHLCVRDVCFWYLTNRADKKLQREMCEALAKKLGLSVVEASAASAEPGSCDEAVPPAVFKSPMERLDYQTRLAKFEREFSDVVRIRHISPILATCFRKIRELLESISRTTGHPLGPAMERIAAETLAEVKSLTSGASRDSDG